MEAPTKGTPEWERRVEFYTDEVLEGVAEWDTGGEDDCRCYVVSTRLIYEIRKLIEPAGLDVSWGHLFDNKKRVMGPECDIVIFRGEPDLEWDGDREGNNIIRIVGIDPSAVCVVIEHKKSTFFRRDGSRIVWRDEQRYARKMQNFSTFGVTPDVIWFVAEYVFYRPRELVSSISTVPSSVVGLGKFFYFYDDVKGEINEVDINRFFDEIAKLH